MTTAAIATRVSTDHQLDGTSLQSQRDDCSARAQADGFEVTLTVEDGGVSGTNLTREGLSRVLEAGRRGEIQRLYVWDFDRLSRATVRETLNLLDDLNRAGVAVFDRYGKEASEADIVFLFNSFQNHDFVKKLSMRVARAGRERALMGRWTCRPPIGYDTAPAPDGKGRVLVPSTDAPVITALFHRAAAGSTYSELRDWLRLEHGLRFGLERIKDILRSETYLGTVKWGKRPRGKFSRASDVITVVGAHPALVDKDTFARIQTRFREPRAINSPKSLPLDNLGVCGHCQSKLYRVTGSRKGQYRYYMACARQRRFKDCQPNQIPLSRLEAALDEATEAMFGGYRTIAREEVRLTKRLLAVIQPSLDAMSKGSADLKARLEREVEKLEGPIEQGLRRHAGRHPLERRAVA